jgi:thiamine-phosphate pyrophosphorylase
MDTLESFMLEKVLIKRKKQLLQDVLLYLITDRSRFGDSTKGETEFLDHIAACLDAGVKIIQLRESRSIATRKMVSLARALRALTWEMNALLIINERADVAKVVDADGLHLNPDDLDVSSAKKILGPEFMVGASVYTQAEAEGVLASEVDYLTAGPIFPSEMVPGQPPVGLNFLEWMIARVDIPWFAAGGIDASNISKIIAHGGKRVALTRALMASKTPKVDTQTLLSALMQTVQLSL